MTKFRTTPITAAELTAEFMRLKRGSVTRRHFLAVTGLGAAAAVLGRSGAFSLEAHAQDLGTQMSLATWPNYHDPASFEAFTAKTGVAIEVNVFGSNEEMLAKLQAGGTGWDLFVPTNYTISTHAKLASSTRSTCRKCRISIPRRRTSASPTKARSTARSSRFPRTGAPQTSPSTPTS